MTVDISHALTTVGEFFASGAGVFLITHIVKKANSIPWISEGQTVRIRSFAGVLSGIATVLVGLSNKSVGTEDARTLITAVLGFVTSWYTAHLANKVLISKQ